jgi:hypothetical protein
LALDILLNRVSFFCSTDFHLTIIKQGKYMYQGFCHKCQTFVKTPNKFCEKCSQLLEILNIAITVSPTIPVNQESITFAVNTEKTQIVDNSYANQNQPQKGTFNQTNYSVKANTSDNQTTNFGQHGYRPSPSNSVKPYPKQRTPMLDDSNGYSSRTFIVGVLIFIGLAVTVITYFSDPLSSSEKNRISAINLEHHKMGTIQWFVDTPHLGFPLGSDQNQPPKKSLNDLKK